MKDEHLSNQMMDQWQPTIYLYMGKNRMIMCVPSPCKSGNAPPAFQRVNMLKMLLLRNISHAQTLSLKLYSQQMSTVL